MPQLSLVANVPLTPPPSSTISYHRPLPSYAQYQRALQGLPLVELHLDHNLIRTAENVCGGKLSNLRVLRLGFNVLENLANLRECFSLAVLDVRFNK